MSSHLVLNGGGLAGRFWRGVGLVVLTLAGEHICAMSRFDRCVLPWFGLPEALPRP